MGFSPGKCKAHDELKGKFVVATTYHLSTLSSHLRDITLDLLGSLKPGESEILKGSNNDEATWIHSRNIAFEEQRTLRLTREFRST